MFVEEAGVILVDIIVIDHICQVLGDEVHVGLGSGLDGRFGAADTPTGINTVAISIIIHERIMAWLLQNAAGWRAATSP